MKQIEVTDKAAALVLNLQDVGFELTKSDIADAQSVIAQLINIGREEESLLTLTDRLLKALFTLSEYNELVNAIREPSDNSHPQYCLDE